MRHLADSQSVDRCRTAGIGVGHRSIMSDAPGAFPQTRWTLVVTAGQETNADAAQALEKLCQDYWYPLYCYVRRRGYSPADAEDLTQGFFQHVLVRRDFAMADAARGRFRSFLLTALKHFLADEWDKSQAQKRGGHCTIVSIDQMAAEERFQAEPADDHTPEKCFEQSWAQTVLAQILEKLTEEQRKAGKEDVFRELSPFVAWSTAVDSDYSKAAIALGMKENAVRVQVFRLRKRYTEILRREIAQTVASPDDVAREIDDLFNALRGDAA